MWWCRSLELHLVRRGWSQFIQIVRGTPMLHPIDSVNGKRMACYFNCFFLKIHSVFETGFKYWVYDAFCAIKGNENFRQFLQKSRKELENLERNLLRVKLFLQDLVRFLQQYCILLHDLARQLATILQEFQFLSTRVIAISWFFQIRWVVALKRDTSVLTVY